MELFKNNKTVIAVVLIVLVMVVLRSTGSNHFKNDARKWAVASWIQANIMSLDHAQSLKGNSLIINLDKVNQTGYSEDNVHNIPPDSILSKKYVNTILAHDGAILLYSSEPGISARIWMILSQMGCKNIYILTENDDNEVLKYKFRPDTLMH